MRFVKAFPTGPIWFTEAAAWAQFAKPTWPFDLSRQARTTANVFTQAVALRKRVARVFTGTSGAGVATTTSGGTRGCSPRRTPAPRLLRRAEAALQDALDTFRACRPGARLRRPCGRLRHPLGSAGPPQDRRHEPEALERHHDRQPAPPRRGPPARGAAGISLAALHRGAGNRAVAGLLGRAAGPALQRAVGWTGDVVTAGRGLERRRAGRRRVRRIPLEGLPVGLQQESAQKFVVDDPKTGAGHFETGVDVDQAPVPERPRAARSSRPRRIGRGQPIEVLVFLHGFTESTGRPFAGWRALVRPASDVPKPGAKLSGEEQQLERLRQGIDSADTAPVRDVALDQAEQQLDESGQAQTVIVLPRAVCTPVGMAGDTNFDAGAYVGEIVARLGTEKAWQDGKGNVVATAAHGAAGEHGRPQRSPVPRWRTWPTRRCRRPRPGARTRRPPKKPPASSALTGDLVLYDAINGSGQLGAFQKWTTDAPRRGPRGG